MTGLVAFPKPLAPPATTTLPTLSVPLVIVVGPVYVLAALPRTNGEVALFLGHARDQGIDDRTDQDQTVPVPEFVTVPALLRLDVPEIVIPGAP